MKKPMLILLALLMASALTLALVARQEHEALPVMVGLTAEPTAESTRTPTPEPAPTEVPPPERVGGEMTVTVPGYQSDVTVSVTVNEAGVITAMTAETAGEAPGLGRKCAEARWTAQFIGHTAPFSLKAEEGVTQVDAVSYATVTSQAVIDAVNALLAAE